MAKNQLPSSSIAMSLCFFFFFFFFIVIFTNESSSARNLGNPAPTHHHHRITFFIRHALNASATKSKPAITEATPQLPFPKPLGLFPPVGGIPIPESEPAPFTGSSLGMFFPPRATLQELEYRAVMEINEDLLGSSLHAVLGKAQGIYVEDGTSHMMAMTASFANGGDLKDGLRFFGVCRGDEAESNVAVIGGTGKYDGANGYATLRAVAAGSGASGSGSGSGSTHELQEADSKFFKFNVYLS